MSVIPSTPVLPAGAAAAPAVTGDRSTAGADVADVFAALVETLTAQLAPGEAAVPAGDAEPEAETGAGAGELVTEALAVDGPPAGVPGWTLAAVSPPAAVAAAGDAAADAPAVVSAPDGVPGPAVGADPLVSLVGPSAATADPHVAVDAPAGQMPPAVEPSAEAVAAPIAGDVTDVTGVGDEPSAEHASARSTDGPPAGVDVPTALSADVAPEPTVAPAGGAVAGVDGTGAVAETSDVQSARPARPAAPPLPEQLVEVIAPLRRAPDGAHRVEIQLRPDELGEVLVDVQVRGNEVNLSLRADLPATSELLREALGELRAELEAAGFRSGDLDVGSHGPRERTPDRPTARPGTGGEPTPTPDADPRPSPVTTGLDLRL